MREFPSPTIEEFLRMEFLGVLIRSRVNRANARAKGERAFALKAEEAEFWGECRTSAFRENRCSDRKTGREKLAARFCLLV